MMTETPAHLLADMEAYQRSWHGPDCRSLEREFDDRLRALEARELLVHPFRNYSDSMIRAWLESLSSVWKEMPYRTWLEILEEIADEPESVYQFLWFASESLALDIHRLAVFHRNIEIELSGETYRDGGPHPISPRLRVRLGDDFDYEAVWRRLAEEGAPMREVPPDASNRHKLEVYVGRRWRPCDRSRT
jgi:hypothetical protein